MSELGVHRSTTETFALVPAPAGELFAILTEPSGTPSGLTVVLCANGPRGCSTVGRDRYFVRLARKLAQEGHHVARFDYHGIGESGGEVGEVRLDEPFVGDVGAVLDWLRSAGHDRFALVGKCFGSRTALETAAARDDVERLALLSLPLQDYRPETKSVERKAVELPLGEHARRALRLRTLANLRDAGARRFYWRVVRAKVRVLRRSATGDRSPVSPGVRRSLQQVGTRGTAVLCVVEHEKLAPFRRAVDTGSLPLPPDTAMVDFPGPFSLMSAETQRLTIGAVTRWLGGRPTP